jgi:hypothetical protein
MGLCHLPQTGLQNLVSFVLLYFLGISAPAKLLETLTFLPSFCPSNTPTTRLRVPFADRP